MPADNFNFLEFADDWAKRAESDPRQAKAFRRLETACRTAARNVDRTEAVDSILKEMRKFLGR